MAADAAAVASGGAPVTVNVSIGRRNVEGGGRSSDYEHSNYRAVVGGKGNLSEAWNYDAYAQYYYTTFFTTNDKYMNFGAIDQSLLVRRDANGNPVCLSGGRCVPWNIFQDGGVTQDQLNFLYLAGTGYGTTTLKTARASLEELVALKAGLRQTTDAERAAAADRVRALTAQADDLRELLAALPPATTPPPNNSTGLAATLRLEPPKDLKAFPTKRVGLTPPVRGTLAIRFGEIGPDGSKSEGVVFETQPEAQIVAPHDGQIVFRGPFRGYGQILIMEHRGGYHTLLCGLGRVDVVVGQWLLAGEPVGITESPKDGKARLYVELRQNGRPIDPWPWLETRINQ